MPVPSFPFAQQAQIIRSNQRDLFHVSSLREQTEGVLRTWLGTRWLSRWDKEIELLVKLVYYGLTVGQLTQTLGEEYTDIWLHSMYSGKAPSIRARAALVLLPTVPSYLLARFNTSLPQGSTLGSILRKIPAVLELASEVNLAVFYLRGTYYSLVKRLLGIRYISSMPQDPNSRPPSYALLGILLGIRIIHRLVTFLRTLRAQDESGLDLASKAKCATDARHETYVDDRPVSVLLTEVNPEADEAPRAEDDEQTILDVAQIPAELRASRTCTLCLEERTSSCATECGHLFCWNCVVGWGREKAECPLCRQFLSLNRLLPVYNL